MEYKQRIEHDRNTIPTIDDWRVFLWEGLTILPGGDIREKGFGSPEL